MLPYEIDYRQRYEGNKYRCIAYGLMVLLCWLVFASKSSFNWLWSVNFWTLWANFFDKQLGDSECAVQFPEAFLHLLSLLGGAPSNALSMFIFNHKLNKASYHKIFSLMCILNVVFVFYYNLDTNNRL